MLIDELGGDEAAPVYLLRLWAHCQNRRTASFENLPATALKALCRFPGHANKLESSFAASGFVRREGQTLIVCGWEEYNASLIANWENGKLGGRPRKKPKPNQPETHGFATGNPPVTHGEPRREEKIGEDVVSDTQRAHEIPSVDDVKDYARSAPVPITEECSVAFHDTQQAAGWITRHGHSIADWRAALRRYASSWNENEKSKASRNGAEHRQTKAAAEYPEPPRKPLPRL